MYEQMKNADSIPRPDGVTAGFATLAKLTRCIWIVPLLSLAFALQSPIADGASETAGIEVVVVRHYWLGIALLPHIIIQLPDNTIRSFVYNDLVVLHQGYP